MSDAEREPGDRVWTIVVAGGSGERFGTAKQYERLGAERVIDRARRTAAEVSDGVVVVVPAADAASEGGVGGGATRTESVRNGLAAVPDDATIICVHDAARPLAGVDVFERAIAAVRSGADGAIPVVPVRDTIKVVDDARVVVHTPDRSALVAVQTPQAFRAEVVRAAYAEAASATTDDAALVEQRGGRVVAVDGSADARKITDRDDLEWIRRRLAASDRPAGLPSGGAR